MNKSESIGKLAEALAKAQSQMTTATKDRENPFFKSSYATLASVIDTLREPFTSNGIAFSQPCSMGDDGSVHVETIFMHTSGEWLSGSVSARPVKNDPQGVGSLISYLKRYLLQAMAGIASADEDDDGNAASQAPQQQRPAQQQQRQQQPDRRAASQSGEGVRGAHGQRSGETSSGVGNGGLADRGAVKAIFTGTKGDQFALTEACAKAGVVSNPLTQTDIDSLTNFDKEMRGKTWDIVHAEIEKWARGLPG